MSSTLVLVLGLEDLNVAQRPIVLDHRKNPTLLMSGLIHLLGDLAIEHLYISHMFR
jgi:hypothetical protein